MHKHQPVSQSWGWGERLSICGQCGTDPAVPAEQLTREWGQGRKEETERGERRGERGNGDSRNINEKKMAPGLGHTPVMPLSRQRQEDC